MHDSWFEKWCHPSTFYPLNSGVINDWYIAPSRLCVVLKYSRRYIAPSRLCVVLKYSRKCRNPTVQQFCQAVVLGLHLEVG